MRRYVIAGSLSVLVHLALAPFVHTEQTRAQEIPAPDITIDHILPPPSPKPTPRATPTPNATPKPLATEPPHRPTPTVAPHRMSIKIVTARATARTGGSTEGANAHQSGDPNGIPSGNGTATPGASTTTQTLDPTPSPRPAPTPLTCARPNVPATTVRAVEPDMPTLAQQQGISGTVEIVVSLDAASHLVAARVQQSPSIALNQAALAAARASQFTTEIRNCQPIAADYLFSVDFTSS